MRTSSSPIASNAGRHCHCHFFRLGSSRLILLAIMTTSCIMLQAQQVTSYVVTENTNNQGIMSRFANVQCELLMTVGRTPNTAMPEEWAASGAKLGLPLNLQFSTKECEELAIGDANQETLLTGPPAVAAAAMPEMPMTVVPLMTVQPLNEPSFTSTKGVETVKVTPGALSCQMQIPETARYSFRFFLDFPEGAVRNDVVLPAERVYFMTACWKEDDSMIQQANRGMIDIKETLEKTNDEIEQMNNSPIGLIQKTLGLRQYFVLLERRRKLVAQIDRLEDAFPPPERLLRGPNDMLFLKEGVIAVKRFQGGQEQYHWIGTFDFRKMNMKDNDISS